MTELITSHPHKIRGAYKIDIFFPIHSPSGFYELLRNMNKCACNYSFSKFHSMGTSHTLTLHHYNYLVIKQRPITTVTTSYLFKTTLPRRRSLKMRDHTKMNRESVVVFAELAQESGAGKRQEQERKSAPSNFDTRIHWENEDEGWIGGSSKNSKREAEEDDDDILARKFSELLNNSSDSHYQFLGVSPNADLEEIKSAYRRLSKEYHPDTTTLPLKSASAMFMKLRDIYNVLSDVEKRKFYDWTLAQEVASREDERMRVKLEDPFKQDFDAYVPVPDMVDRLGGKNIPLSDQAISALTFDILIIIFAIGCIIYVAYFKEPY